MGFIGRADTHNVMAVTINVFHGISYPLDPPKGAESAGPLTIDIEHGFQNELPARRICAGMRVDALLSRPLVFIIPAGDPAGADDGDCQLILQRDRALLRYGTERCTRVLVFSKRCGRCRWRVSNCEVVNR